MTENLTRRRALTASLGLGVASLSACGRKTTLHKNTHPDQNGVFAHGVASGEPAHDSVVLWSRISLSDPVGPISVHWEIATDDALTNIVRAGETQTDAGRDWTVKVVPSSLKPGTTYFYRFSFGDNVSPIGRTRTVPDGHLDKARFAAVSCSNYPFGFFNVYDHIARQDDIDAVLHLGDYLYEYGHDGYGGNSGKELGREHEPAHEIISLSDYRTRHAQYRSDPAAQAMLARHPLIAIWDDHETSNDSWKDGAQNHQDDEGDWHARKNAALQAYYEWMPVRPPLSVPEALFKTFNYGDLLNLSAIETRLMARSEPLDIVEVMKAINNEADAEHFKANVLNDPSRELLGAAQLAYLKNAFTQSAAQSHAWRLVANQVIMAQVKAPNVARYMSKETLDAARAKSGFMKAMIDGSAFNMPNNLDAWDGYPAARERFYDLVRNTGDSGLIVVTGDTHTWWANELARANGAHMGVELGTHAVTSPSSFSKTALDGQGENYALLMNKDNPSVRYISGENQGYIDLTIRRDKAVAKFVAVSTIKSRDYESFDQARFVIENKKGAAHFTKAAALGPRQRVLYHFL